MWIRQVEARGLEDERSAPNCEEPADPSEDQPRVDESVMFVCVWWTGVGEGGLESLKVAVGRWDQIGLVGGDDDGGRDCGAEDGEDSEY